MKTVLSLLLSVCAWGAVAGEAIVTTIVSRPTLTTNVVQAPGVPLFEWRAVTNIIDIPNGQAARFVTAAPYTFGVGGQLFSPQVTVTKNGVAWSPMRGDVIQGPARFELGVAGALAGEVANGSPSVPAPSPVVLTVERWTVRKATAAQLAQ